MANCCQFARTVSVCIQIHSKQTNNTVSKSSDQPEKSGRFAFKQDLRRTNWHLRTGPCALIDSQREKRLWPDISFAFGTNRNSVVDINCKSESEILVQYELHKASSVHGVIYLQRRFCPLPVFVPGSTSLVPCHEALMVGSCFHRQDHWCSTCFQWVGDIAICRDVLESSSRV